MKKNILFISILLLLVMISSPSQAQMDSTLRLCQSHLNLPFISDGQTYTALLNGDEVAEFYATFYGGSTYRIIGYTGVYEGNLVFSIFDEERNLLFTNSEYENTPYWDFEFDYTMNCVIETRLDTKHLTSGISVLLIGFQQ